VPSLLAASVAAVPPVVLLAITHLTVILTRTPAPQAHPAVWSVSSRSRGDAPSDPAISPGPGVEGKPTPLSRDERGAAVPDRRARGWELRQSGWSNKRIARELQVHPSTVGRWFAAAHLPDTNDETAAERKETTP
jgi:hypothetical protein